MHMKICLPPFLYFAIYLLLPGFYFYSATAQERVVPVELHWKEPVSEARAQNNFVPSLTFKGSIQEEDRPEIPVYSHKEPSRVPHFSHTFQLNEKVIIPCTPEEIRILENAGFSESDFSLNTLSETSMGDTWTRLELTPVRKREGQYEKLVSFDLHIAHTYDAQLKHESLHQYPESSVLAEGDWFRLCVQEEGIYRITHQELTELGVNMGQLSKSTIQLYGNGGGNLPESNAEPRFTDLQENAIWISGNQSGNFTSDDYILFYGQSPHRWKYNSAQDLFNHEVHHYADETCYFLTYARQEGKRVQQRPGSAQTPTHEVQGFYDFAYHQRDLVNLIGSGKMWFGELFDVTLSRDFSFEFPNISRQHPARIGFHGVAHSRTSSTFTLASQGQSRNFTAPPVTGSSVTSAFALAASGTLEILPSADKIDVKLSYNRTTSGGRAWLNYITVNAQRELIASGSQMFFRNPSVRGQGNVARFQIRQASSQHRVWDVSDPLNVLEQQVQLSGTTMSFLLENPGLNEFVIFDGSQFLSPRLRGRVPNQNLHALELHDLFILVPDLFRAQAERLASFRRSNDGLRVMVVSPQQVYNEFSSGVPDISAIRNFMKMFYDRAAITGEYPRYLLLFGSGTYDNKNRLGYGGNLIPTFQTQQSLSPASSYISDDFFGLLDDNEGFDAMGAIDLGIGRIPVRTADEARFVVDKILRYNQRVEGLVPGTDDPRFAGRIPNYADWRSVVTFIADDGDGNIHFNQSEQIAGYLDDAHPVYNVEKIYLDAYEQVSMAGGSRYPEVNKSINARINQGTLLVNYIGHGGPLGLAQERILTFDDILLWGNFYNLPVFMTATCEFSSFDQPDPNELSAGMRIFLKPDGGASALFTTTRLAYSHSNFTLNDAFMRNAFVPMENGQMPRLGDLIRMAKVQSSSTGTLKNFVLLGDPSMQMAYPHYRVVTTEAPDTMRALQKVTISGQVQTPDGSLASGYNGIIYPTIYDKAIAYTTRGNDPASIQAGFSMQNRILYRGKASVSNGAFSFSFIVPRDISYNTGQGKISYYLDDGSTLDGHGYFNNFIISGTSDSYTPDNQGPEIGLYLNNTGFQSGDKTGPNPILLAYLSDESGINTTGQVGHDIVAFLNDDTSNPIVLNNFYQADLDDFRSGRVVYPFFNLEQGEYTLSLRAWDAHNNFSTATIDFIVTSAPGLQISSLKNYPNPFSDYTYFTFGHNKPATELNVQIEIYTLGGQRVKSLEQKVYASGFDVPPLEWDGRDDGGTLLHTGLYIFRAVVFKDGAEKVHESEKLMILR